MRCTVSKIWPSPTRLTSCARNSVSPSRRRTSRRESRRSSRNARRSGKVASASRTNVTARDEKLWLNAGMEYGAIVVGTDGTEAANETVRHGAALARSSGAMLHIVSAYRDLDGAGGPQAAAKAILEDAANQ